MIEKNARQGANFLWCNLLPSANLYNMSTLEWQLSSFQFFELLFSLFFFHFCILSFDAFESRVIFGHDKWLLVDSFLLGRYDCLLTFHVALELIFFTYLKITKHLSHNSSGLKLKKIRHESMPPTRESSRLSVINAAYTFYRNNLKWFLHNRTFLGHKADIG